MVMDVTSEALIPLLAQMNPWWRGEAIPDLPTWQRTAYRELWEWVASPPAPRALLVSGARQVGKTTLFLQAIDQLLKTGVPPGQILYATFDHPLIKAAGPEAVLRAWRELAPSSNGPEYLFLDEAQFIPHFSVWVKHQVDFARSRRIFFTGSATPLLETDPESGVGRWHTLILSPLSFYEYLQIKKIALPPIPKPGQWTPDNSSAHFLTGHFHEFLIRGGYPQTVLMESLTQAQRFLREDILDKVLKRDMTSLFGVRRIQELEQTFIYLCMHNGGLLDLGTLSKNMGISKPTVQNFLELLEAAHLLYQLPPYGYGKEILRARYKYYLADTSLAPAILMKGKMPLEDPEQLGQLAENAVITHLITYARTAQARVSFWRNAKDREVDLIFDRGGTLTPIEVKYRTNPSKKELQGLFDFCETKQPAAAYLVTKSPDSIGPSKQGPWISIPAPLFCYWLGESTPFL